MGLGRYVTRRHIALLQYLALIGGLYLVYCVVSDGRPQQKDTWQAERFPGAAPVREPQQRRKVPQVAGADHDWVNHPSFDHDWSKFRGLGKKDWTDHEAYESDLKRVGPGEQGSGVEIPKDRADEALALYKANGYNALVSDLIPLNRSVKDLRHPGCKALTYLEKLPTVSVILPFHEEHNSTLIRSAWSIINRTPPELLEEIILVDDCSEKPFLLKPLEEFWARNGLADKVKVLRTSKREGLIRARQLGAQAATGEVLVFLDAHSEVLYNWLPPLVDPIADDYRTVVCPFIDVIDCENYELRPQDQGARGSFDWRFDYKRLPLTRDDRNNPTRPFNSPVMAGGYFAISAKWFWELGGYDEGLDIWGGEQYELSFKVWQCHGKMVDAPCSRVGHIYRCKYSPFKSAGVGDFVSRNYKRVAEVWMDEYKEHLYNKRPSIRDAKEGDLSRMKGIRQKLQCKSFDWFMKEVAFDQDKYYPAVPPSPSTHGEVRHGASGMCIDLEFKGSGQRFGMRKCVSDSEAGTGGGDQNITVTRWHDIRPAGRDVCFDASSSNDHAPIQLFGCHSMKGNQLFKYRLNDLQIYHPISGQCLAGESSGSGELFMMKCNPSDQNQQWKWQHVDKNLLEERDQKEKEEGDP